MAWSPDGRYLATCNSADTSLRIYATKDWSVAKDFGREIAGACQKPAFSSDGKELTMWGGDLITFATNDWHEIRLLKGMRVEGARVIGIENEWDKGLLLHDMAYVPGTHTLVFGGGQYEKNTEACGRDSYPYPPSTGRVWMLKPRDTALTRSFIVYCPPKGGSVTYLAVRPDGEQLATLTQTNGGAPHQPITDATHIVGFPSGQLLGAPLDGLADGGYKGVAYAPDGRFVLAGGGLFRHRGYVYIVDAHTLQLVDTVRATDVVLDVAVAPDSSMFAAAAGSGITIWRFVQP